MIPHLVELCLDSVAENFSGHQWLFTTSEDFYTQRKLAFLQKKYSPDLISRLGAKEGGLDEEFIDILVNKYTKFLDTSWFEKCPLDKLSSKLAEIGRNLEKIVCHHECVKDGFSEAIRDSICHLRNLKSFTFHVMCDDWILENVAKFCRNIEEMDVKDSAITSEGVSYLCRDKNGKRLCTTLKKLCFGENRYINDNDVVYLLQNLPSLEIIDLPEFPLVLYALHELGSIPLDKVAPYNITTLNLMTYYDFLDDIVEVIAAVCPRLKNFSSALIKKQLSYLFDLPDLEQLYLYNLFDSEEMNLDSYLTSKGSRLTSLSIRHCTVSVSVLAEKCPSLEELILWEANVLGDEDSKPVFSSLSSLTLIRYYHTLNAKGIKLMLSSSSFIQLESLSFKDCYFESPELKVAILKCCELHPVKNVAIYSSQIEKEFLEILLRICRTLRYLTLDDRIDHEDREDVLCFAKRLPNKPKISICSWILPAWLSLLSR